MHLLSVTVSVLQYACLFICLSLIKYQSDHGYFTSIALSGRAQSFRSWGYMPSLPVRLTYIVFYLFRFSVITRWFSAVNWCLTSLA